MDTIGHLRAGLREWATLVSLVVIASLSVVVIPSAQAESTCPLPERYTLPLLQSSDALDLCSVSENRVLLVVNTASECGFTPQFEALEQLYQRYRDRGLSIIGVPSDDFNQELSEAAAIADVCYLNYGVTFPMLAPTQVKGDKATPVFQWLAAMSGEQPRWNFNKYLVSRDGGRVRHYNASVSPLNSSLEQAIIKALTQ